MAKKTEISLKDRIDVWDGYLHGEGVTETAFMSRHLQKRILSEPMPDQILRDHRYIDGCRYTSICDTKDGLVFVRTPRVMSAKAWQGMARNLKRLRPTLEYTSSMLAEPMPEHDVVFRMVNERGISVWHCDADGKVEEATTRPYFTGPSTQSLPVPAPIGKEPTDEPEEPDSTNAGVRP